jgi:hypothetical protein
MDSWLTPLGGILFTALMAVVVMQFVLFLVRKVHARAVARLEPEGIVRRSGRVRIYLKLRNFVSAHMRSGATSIRTGELVLTGKGLVLVMPYPIRLGAPPWTALKAQVIDGKVHLETEQPPEATGKVEVTVHAPEPEAWISALSPQKA